MTLSEMLERVERLDLKAAIPDLVIKQEAALIDLNTSQLEMGMYSDDFPIEPIYANDDYADFKKSLGSKAPFRTPNLNLDGGFYQGFEMAVNGTDYSFNSSDWKTEHLVDKYGQDIFGLSEKNKAIFAKEILIYEIREYITSITGLIFQ